MPLEKMIKISTEVRDDLLSLGSKGETYSHIIARLIEYYKKDQKKK
jgi:predicted CopG family antitoxin